MQTLTYELCCKVMKYIVKFMFKYHDSFGLSTLLTESFQIYIFRIGGRSNVPKLWDFTTQLLVISYHIPKVQPAPRIHPVICRFPIFANSLTFRSLQLQPLSLVSLVFKLLKTPKRRSGSIITWCGVEAEVFYTELHSMCSLPLNCECLPLNHFARSISYWIGFL